MNQYSCVICKKKCMGMPTNGELYKYQVCSHECLDVEKGLNKMTKNFWEHVYNITGDDLDKANIP